VIASIEFRKFRVLEEAALPLGAFNLLLGPNGSGKTTAVRALLALGQTARAVQAGQPSMAQSDLAGARAEFSLDEEAGGRRLALSWDAQGHPRLEDAGGDAVPASALAWLAGFRGFVLDPAALPRPVPLDTAPVLSADGAGLAAVLGALRQSHPQRWETLIEDFRRLLPEAQDVVAGKTVDATMAFSVTTVQGRTVPAANLSQGTLVILGLLAIVHGPERPTLLCLEELERGLHPRLLRDARDLLYRLSFPGDCGETAPPVQVVATTHSPYVLDLFADTPEDVILATKGEGAATFKRLTDVPELRELLRDGRLGDLWYSGILGGTL
jgi:predicted ATPase